MEAVRHERVQGGAPDAKAKHLIAVAVAFAKQCADCVRAHTRHARREGATEGEIVEAMEIARAVDLGGVGRSSTRPLDPPDDPWIELDHYE